MLAEFRAMYVLLSLDSLNSRVPVTNKDNQESQLTGKAL